MIEALVFGLLGPIAGLLTFIVLGGGLKDLPLDTFVIVFLFAYLASFRPS
jgi:hypothetical protein